MGVTDGGLCPTVEVIGSPAVFLDRDGVVNELIADSETGLPESPLHSKDVRLVSGAADAIRALHEAGYRVVCVTNQPAAAKGVVSVEQLLSVQAQVVDLLRQAGTYFDAARICLHHPDGVGGDLAVPCCCRKPRPGMLLSAAKELGVDLRGSWMIGDTDADIAAGQAVGCRTIMVETIGSSHKRAGSALPDVRAADLSSAASIVVRIETKD